MWVNQIFSLINNGKVQNIIVADNYTVANDIAKTTYGSDAFAIDTTLYPVSIGYSFLDGVFMDESGKVIERNMTEAERIEALKLENESLKQQLFVTQEGLDFLMMQ